MKTSHVGVIALAMLALVSCTTAGGVDTAAPSPAAFAGDVRRATHDFTDPAAARTAGYAPFLGCVSGPQEGAMGVHFVNGGLVGDGVLDARRPEALMYEARDRRLHLVGVEYIVLAEAWNAKNKTPPMLMGQSFHYTGTPNRYGIPAF